MSISSIYRLFLDITTTLSAPLHKLNAIVDAFLLHPCISVQSKRDPRFFYSSFRWNMLELA